MVNRTLSRRTLLVGAGGLGAAAALGGCATSGSGGSGDSGGPLVLQSSLSDEAPRDALAAVVDDYSAHEVTVNTIAIETFRAQLPTYLSASDPPDVLTWYAGSVARDYASRGFLLDVSDLWSGDGACAGFSDALRELSTDQEGRQIFVPTNYYWWGMFYRRSAFAEWGVQPAETWEDFLSLCQELAGQGVNPLAMGTGGTPWVASGWFDYLNLRINGVEFHRELLAGEHSFDGPEVREVMAHYRELLPYLDPDGRSQSWQDAVTPLVNRSAGMYLIGAFITQLVPEEDLDDIDFFRVPVVDPAVPLAEEAPTDGYFASANSTDPEGARSLLSHLVAPESQQEFIELSASSNLPTSPDVDTSRFSPLVRKGVELLDESAAITQFFNRDSSDELQTTADDALTRFLDSPDDVDEILADWQAAAERVFSS